MSFLKISSAENKGNDVHIYDEQGSERGYRNDCKLIEYTPYAALVQSTYNKQYYVLMISHSPTETEVSCTNYIPDNWKELTRDYFLSKISKESSSNNSQVTSNKKNPALSNKRPKEKDEPNKAFVFTIFGLIVAEGFIACIPGGLIRNVASDNVALGITAGVWLALAVATIIFRKTIYIVAKFLALFILFVGGFGIFAWGQFEKGSVGIGILLAVLAVLFGVLIVIKGIKAFKER